MMNKTLTLLGVAVFAAGIGSALAFTGSDLRLEETPINRLQGTVYGGLYGASTSPDDDEPRHQSGSLSGHIIPPPGTGARSQVFVDR